MKKSYSCIKLAILLLTINVLSGCLGPLVQKNQLTNKVSRSINADSNREYEQAIDKITGFAINSQKSEMLIVTEKMYIIGTMDERFKLILAQKYIIENIEPAFGGKHEKRSLRLSISYADPQGVELPTPLVGSMSIEMCFKNPIPSDQTYEFRYFMSKHGLSITDNPFENYEKPCLILPLIVKGGKIFPLGTELNVAEITKLSNPLTLELDIYTKKDKSKQRLQKTLATTLFPVTYVIDKTYELTQYIALPVTIWFK